MADDVTSAPDVPPAPKSIPKATTATATQEPEGTTLGQLIPAAYVTTGYESWILAGAAEFNGWDEDTVLTKTDVKDGVEKWLAHVPEREE